MELASPIYVLTFLTHATEIKHYVPKEMNNAFLAIIYKKGATDKPENYRPIALVSLSYKIFAKMIQVWLCKGPDEHLDSQQYGFRKATGTSRPLFIYRRILDLHEEAGL